MPNFMKGWGGGEDIFILVLAVSVSVGARSIVKTGLRSCRRRVLDTVLASLLKRSKQTHTPAPKERK